LLSDPGGPFDVTASTTATSDPDVTLQGTQLHFDSSNFDTPQYVVVSAAHDADTTDDLAVVQFTQTGDTVVVRVTDDNTPPPPADAGPVDAPLAIDGPPGPDARPVPDGPPGPDAPPRPDAPLGADGGPGAATATCGCGVGAGPGGGSALALLVLLALRRRRR